MRILISHSFFTRLLALYCSPPVLSMRLLPQVLRYAIHGKEFLTVSTDLFELQNMSIWPDYFNFDSLFLLFVTNTHPRAYESIGSVLASLVGYRETS